MRRRAGGRPEAVPLYCTERNPSRETTGGRVAAVSAKVGEPYIPWQRMVADIAHEIDPHTGLPWYSEVLIVAQRQTGKSSQARAELTDTCLFTPGATVRYTAQTRLMAYERLERDFYLPLRNSPLRAFLDTSVGLKRRERPGFSGKTGSEHISFANGSVWRIDSVKAASGHGPKLNKGLIDEAFAHVDSRVEGSMIPATTNVPDSQLWIMSAAGDHTSTYLKDKLAMARARVEMDATKPLHERTSHTMLVEYGAPRSADREDPETLWKYHPAVGYLTTIAKLEAARQASEANPQDWDRAYLSWWPERKVADPIIPRLAWGSCALEEAQINWTGDPVWAVDVAPDRDWSAIGMAARHSGRRAYVELLAHEQGTHWVVRHLVTLRAEHGGDMVAIDGSGAAGALEAELAAAGFIVKRMTLRDKIDACGGLYDDALSGELAHPGDPVLNTALFSSVKKSTDGAWTFWRGKSLLDISPVYAVTLARHLLVQLVGTDYNILDSLR